jgi:PAS domain S-box-containing protein
MRIADDQPLVLLLWALVVSLVFLPIGSMVLGPASQDLMMGYFLAIVAASLGILCGMVMQRVRTGQQYRRMLEDGPHPMWIHDEHTHALLDVNEAAVRGYGYSRDELLTMTLGDLLPGDGKARRKDGSRVEVEVVSTRVPFAGRSAQLAIVCDVTARVRAEEEARQVSARYREFFEGVPVGMFRTAPEGGFEDVNPALAEMFGYPDCEALRGIRVTDLYADVADRARLRARVELEGAVRAFEVDLRRRDGTIFQGAISARVVRDDHGRVVGYEGLIEDVTERRKSEETLLEALQKSEESDWLKGNFLATMSHEIRTPLNIILGYTELLGSDDDGESAELVQAIRRASHRLINTVHGMLDLAKLQSSSFECRPVDLNLPKLVQEHVQPFLAMARRKGLGLSCAFEAPDAEVRFDEYCLTKALESLVDNAVKFTPRGEITVRIVRDPLDHLRLEVQDTGIGISAEHLPRLFEPFAQEAAGDSRPFEGAGVSLAVAKGLVELNGGRITVESEKGMGTTFAIHFDRGSEVLTSPGQAGNGASANGKAVKPTILVVEDDEASQIYVDTILRGSSRLLMASTAGEARQILAREQGKIRLVLMDVSLKGDEDGLDLTRHIRSQTPLRDLPVIATTAHALQEWRLRAAEAGCSGFLSKPFSPKQLLAAVEGFLQGSEKRLAGVSVAE